MHRVVKPFPCSWDGITLIDLNAGDERDFGPLAKGLVAAGFIEPIGKPDAREVGVDVEPIEVVAVDTVDEDDKPRRSGKRK